MVKSTLLFILGGKVTNHSLASYSSVWVSVLDFPRYNNRYQFLQIDLGRISKIIRLGTQGRSRVNQWVTYYYLSSSIDGIHFAKYRQNSRDKVKILGWNQRFIGFKDSKDIAAHLAQLDKRRSAEREVAGSNPGQTNTQGLKITRENVLPLL